MIILDEKATGLEESAKAIGLSYGSQLSADRGMNVMKSLVSKPLNSGEANMLTGVNVQFSIIASVKWWQQAQRYHWFQIVMSQSIMHNIANPKFVLTPNHFAQSEVGALGTTSPVIDAFIKYRDDLLDRYKGVPMPPKIKRELIYSVPVGMLEEARVTTNYLQLMTMYTQRINHQLDEWRYFCAWMYKRLPYFKELVEARGCDLPDTRLLSLIPEVCPDVLD